MKLTESCALSVSLWCLSVTEEAKYLPPRVPAAALPLLEEVEFEMAFEFEVELFEDPLVEEPAPAAAAFSFIARSAAVSRSISSS